MGRKASKEWERVRIRTDAGEEAEAVAPVIISASRATDIPAFYSDWFLKRLGKGHLRWTNPFNNRPLYVSFCRTRLIVFWSKNPRPILGRLRELDERGLNYYFQFTLNDYEAEGLEPNVPAVAERVETFRELSRRIGPDRVVWRFDPLLITARTPPELLLEKLTALAGRLQGLSRRLVFSFADIEAYRRVKRNLDAVPGLGAREFTGPEKEAFAKGLAERNRERGWGFELATCAEEIDLSAHGIEHNRCIDDRLMIRRFRDDAALMAFLGVPPAGSPGLFPPPSESPPGLRDKGQRPACGCIRSKDIGEYNTCPHRCLYCYANTSPESAAARAAAARNLGGESITGKL